MEQNPKSEDRRLLKSIHIYSDGSTLERSYANRVEEPKDVSNIVACTEFSVLRRFSRHYQFIVRVYVNDAAEQLGAAELSRRLYDETMRLSSALRSNMLNFKTNS